MLSSCTGKILQKSLCRVFDICGSFAQIVVVDLRNGLEVALEDYPDGILGDIFFLANLTFDLLNDCRVFENQSVHVEDRPFLFGNKTTHSVFDNTYLLNSSFDCRTEPLHLALRISSFFLLDGADFHTWLKDVSAASAKTW